MAARPAKRAVPAPEAVRAFASQAAWAAWLAKNHDKAPGLWLRIAKAKSGIASVTYAEAVETALRYGWIDGQKKSDGDDFWQQRFTPRGKRSIWSKTNRDKALALIASGAMEPSGLAEVERAKADGRWDAAYDPPSKMAPHPDFAGALARNPRAKAFFATLDSANRYSFLFRVHAAKKPETRARKIAEFVAMLADKRKLHP